MHFSKTYTELLLSLPPELRSNAIEYRKLKKLINQVVQELTALGLAPDVLHQVLLQSNTTNVSEKGKEREVEIDGPEPGKTWVSVASSQDASTGLPRVVYEINTDSDKLEPRLRVLVNTPLAQTTMVEVKEVEGGEEGEEHSANKDGAVRQGIQLPILSQLEAGFDQRPHSQEGSEIREPTSDTSSEIRIQSPATIASNTNVDPESIPVPPPSCVPSSIPGYVPKHSPDINSPNVNVPLITNRYTALVSSQREVVIPLHSDTAFFQLLMQALQTLSTQLGTVADEFIENLHDLSRSISSAARPISATSHHAFVGHSSITDPAAVRVPSTHHIIPFTGPKSDLYQWREIFQMYVDLEVFENHGERERGERSVEDAEQRLEMFKQRLIERGYMDGKAMRVRESRDAVDRFFRLNVFILDLKKFQFATTEATRKILKKHAKRTALPVSPSLSSLLTIQPHPHDPASALVLTTRPGTSLAQMLVQAVGETILPIVPHIDDYECVICTSIAFKPIRLQCGHLFCVRCLVKMQKRGKGNCPMCRAPTVLQADRSNVDWALLNFMKDWFPIEAKEKLDQSEREAAEEQMRELGFSTDAPCVVM